jgi:bifunctional enzyme CysN/CysC
MAEPLSAGPLAGLAEAAAQAGSTPTLAVQPSYVIWFTGLSGAGKSTIAQLTAQRLAALGLRAYVLDGDELRRGLSSDLGFSPEARTENIRRAAEVARLMVDAGLIVLAAFISPLHADRLLARNVLGPGKLVEVFVDAPLAVTEARDTKGLYRLARQGKIKQFTGIDAPYEAPLDAEVVLETRVAAPAESAEALLQWLGGRGLLGGPNPA